MKKISIITDDKRIKLTFLDYNNVVIQDKDFRDTVFNKVMPVAAYFDSEVEFSWVYTEKFGLKNFFNEGAVVGAEMSVFIEKARQELLADIKELFSDSELNEYEQFDGEEW